MGVAEAVFVIVGLVVSILPEAIELALSGGGIVVSVLCHNEAGYIRIAFSWHRVLVLS